jgi:hypothetical protein
VRGDLYMENEKLLKLAYSKLPLLGDTSKDIAFLLKTLTEEQIFFSINYTAREFYEELERESLAEVVTRNKEEIIKYYELAKVKQAQEQLKESEIPYDSKNVHKGNDTPSWFRESFNKHLFK